MMFKKYFKTLIVLALGLWGITYGLFPQAFSQGEWEATGILLFFLLTLALYYFIGLKFNNNSLSKKTIITGLVMGGLWAIEILTGNMGWHLNQTSILLFYSAPVALVPILNIYIGFTSYTEQPNLSYAIKNGIAAGMLSGLVAFIFLMFVVLQMHIQQADPQNIAEFARSGAENFSAYLVQNYTFAGTNHLWIGLIGGYVFGLIGGLMRKAIMRVWP